MNAKKYLKLRLTDCTKYELSSDEKKTLQYEGIETYIFRKLKSKKFRKTKLDNDSEKQIKEAIATNVSKNEPIKFTYPFGGYKIWRVPDYPCAGWSEFMTINYVCSYVAPILAGYEPGVEFYFSSDDVVIELIDNFPRKDLDKYVASFKSLIAEFSKYFPQNMKMELKQVVPDIYKTKEEYEKELEELYKEFKLRKYTEEDLIKSKKKFIFHFQKKGQKDYSGFSEKELSELWNDLLFWSDAYLALEKRKDFVRGNDRIVLFSNPIPLAIDIGSNQVSKAKFWAGYGVLEKDNDKFFERILSPSQWEKSKKLARTENINFLSQPNFKSVHVFEKRLDFLKN
ncbi:hypothetical protein JW710_03390 [Candidatus Dojkabacteria bacterium]|nr:hypothetical protein [Candidatus Dojkabacteria bacterium]